MYFEPQVEGEHRHSFDYFVLFSYFCTMALEFEFPLPEEIDYHIPDLPYHFMRTPDIRSFRKAMREITKVLEGTESPYEKTLTQSDTRTYKAGWYAISTFLSSRIIMSVALSKDIAPSMRRALCRVFVIGSDVQVCKVLDMFSHNTICNAFDYQTIKMFALYSEVPQVARTLRLICAKFPDEFIAIVGRYTSFT